MRNKTLSMALAAGAPLLAAPAIARACAVCLTGANDSTVDGFNASVLFLMATPYMVLGSIVGALVIAYRSAIKKRAQAEAREEGVRLALNQEESGR